MRHHRGLLIVFEGIDGTGKSTQIKQLQDFLEMCGHLVVTTREPTDGPFGRQIRQRYHTRDQLTKEQELKLFLEDRHDHVVKVIEPSLSKGRIVLCDRYFLSTAAYQGAAGFDPDDIIAQNNFAPTPDLALLFELDPVEAVRRITEHRGDRPNDFEQLDYLKKVDTVFRRLRLPYIRRIDAARSIDEIQAAIRNHVENLLNATFP